MCCLINQYCGHCGLMASWWEVCPSNLRLRPPGNKKPVFWNGEGFCKECHRKEKARRDKAGSPPDYLVYRMRGFNACAVKAFVTYRIGEGYPKTWTCCRCRSTITVITDGNVGVLYCNSGEGTLLRPRRPADDRKCHHMICGKCDFGARPTKSDMGGPEQFATVGEILQRMRDEEAAGRSQPELEIKSNRDTPKGTMVDDQRGAGKERERRRDGPSNNSTEQPGYAPERVPDMPISRTQALDLPPGPERIDSPCVTPHPSSLKTQTQKVPSTVKTLRQTLPHPPAWVMLLALLTMVMRIPGTAVEVVITEQKSQPRRAVRYHEESASYSARQSVTKDTMATVAAKVVNIVRAASNIIADKSWWASSSDDHGEKGFRN
ncbi:hypothetical protein QBC37DRAFT_374030 [Rhypophila decipiens]|uniref:Uncharacterized protein n=1 Tax=Rhypophila decipiens TaxID=261697 RepID=A0AAN6Y642_9PEZI|nr:hypothetical protein QBC37DRAFT_374030 [Rhypophila decipiens]